MKSTFILFALSSILLLSCNKEGEVMSQKAEEEKFHLSQKSKTIIDNNSSLEQVFEKMTYDEARSAFQTLTFEEIQNLRLSRLEDFSNSRDLTLDQINQLLVLEDIILNIENINNENLLKKEKLWLFDAKNEFSNFEIFNIAYSIKRVSEREFALMLEKMNNKNPSETAKEIGGGSVSSLADCNCSIDSYFSCIGGFGGTCLITKCGESRGCGFLWAFECGGRCGVK